MELNAQALTVVITDDTQDGQAVVDLAEQWHELGLLADFAIVTPRSIITNGHGPAEISAHVVGGEGQVDLMAHLGSRRRQLIRLVVLHMLTHEHSSADRLVSACNQVAGLVQRAMPVRSSASDAEGIRLLRVNLLVPESDLAPQSVDILQPGWEINAVVSPEDRPDLDRLSVFVRAATNLHGHALAAAASVGGLWRGMNRAVFDTHELDSTGGARDVVVLRCHTKMIVGDERAELLTSSALEAVVGEPDGAVQHINWGFPSDRPTEVVDGLVSTLLQEPEWAPLEREYRPLQVHAVPMSQLLADWLRFQATLPLAAVGFLTGRAISAVERGVTSAVIGADAGVIGRIVPLSPQEASRRATSRLTELARALEPARLSEAAATWGQATPTAWRTLREVAIGQVDGSELPGNYVRQRRANLDEVLPPSFVVPIPSDGTALNQAGAIRSVDVAKVAQIASESPEPTEAVQEQPVEDSGSEEREKAPVKTGETSSESVQIRGGDDAGTAIGATELESWVEQRRESLFWKLATRVYEFRRREGGRFSEAVEALTTNADAPPTYDLERARRTLVGCWVLTALGLLLVAGWLWIESWGTQVPWLPESTWRKLTIVVVSLVLISVIGGHLYYRALRKYEWAVRRQMHALAAASDEYVVASQQEKRWALMYEGVLDWADVLAQLLHRPWILRPRHQRSVHEDFKGLPAAVAIARPTGDAMAPTPDLVSAVVESLCDRGWLKEEFQRFLVKSPANDPSSSGSWGDLPADMDLGLRAGGPRADLRRVAESGVARDEATEAALEKVARLVADAHVKVPSLTVQRLGPYSAGELQSDRDFLLGTNDVGTPLAADVFSDRARVSGFATPEIIAMSVPDASSRSTLLGAEISVCDVSLSTRVDVSRALQPSEL